MGGGGADAAPAAVREADGGGRARCGARARRQSPARRPGMLAASPDGDEPADRHGLAPSP